jgi:hypothetical protein
MEMVQVKKGQKWMSNDRRAPEKFRRDRAFTVLEVSKALGKARVAPVSATGKGARIRWIALHRFRPTATGYVPYVEESK